MDRIRCKFICMAIRTSLNNVYNDETKQTEKKKLYVAEFSIVMDGSEENKKFFQWTPFGKLEIGQYKEDVFKVGEEYYLDVSLVE